MFVVFSREWNPVCGWKLAIFIHFSLGPPFRSSLPLVFPTLSVVLLRCSEHRIPPNGIGWHNSFLLPLLFIHFPHHSPSARLFIMLAHAHPYSTNQKSMEIAAFNGQYSFNGALPINRLPIYYCWIPFNLVNLLDCVRLVRPVILKSSIRFDSYRSSASRIISTCPCHIQFKFKADFFSSPPLASHFLGNLLFLDDKSN